MELKVVFIGDGAVGKTSLLRSYLNLGLPLMMTIGVDFYRVKIDEKIGLIIWDLGGQEHFRPFVKDFIKGASVVVLAFDQSRPDTFDNIKKYWEPLILEVLGDQVPVILVGNKIDLAEIISEDLVQQYIQHSKLNIKGYVKTSALQKKGLDVLFEKIKEAVYELIKQAKASQ